MWGYQLHYRVHLEAAAESVLQEIDKRFSPEIFLVGVLRDQLPERHPACVEPESECWVESTAFAQVPELANEIRAKYPESALLHSHPLAQQREDEFLYRRSIRDAIIQIVNDHPDRPKNLTFFGSLPEMVEGYLVTAVLAVQTDVLNSHHRLAADTVSLHEYRKISVARSLCDAAIYEILSHAADALSGPNPGLGTRSPSKNDLLRAAARNLVAQTAFRVDPTEIGNLALYDDCEEISCLKYEKAETRGKLLLAKRNRPSIRSWITFAGPVSLRNHRRARKLLELASGNCALHTNGLSIFGLVDPEAQSDSDETLFEICFLGHHHWELRHAGQVLMGSRFGKPYLPKPVGYESKLRQDLQRFFPDITTTATESLVSLVRQAENERHGTLLVISHDASDEATRLANQATQVSVCPLTPDLLSHLTGIDGAVLLDTRGHCHAIGVILDGLATSQGDPSRGARFNSAVRYVESAIKRGIATLAVVVSEDGGIDFIPDPPPRIKRSTLVNVIQEIEAISKSTEIPRARFNHLYDWLKKHGFYLLQEDCERVNTAVTEVERRFHEEDPMAIRILRDPFAPHPGMDRSFYYEVE